MPRIRTLKPEAPQHRKVGTLSVQARWLWVTMITQADDEGRLVAEPAQLKLWAFGYDADITADKVATIRDEVAASGLIRVYTVHDVTYALFPSWADHQRIDRPMRSKLPLPEGMRSTKTRRGLVDRSSSVRRGSRIKEGIKDQGGEGSGEERNNPPVAPAPGSASPLRSKQQQDPDGFQVIWTAYPKRVARLAAVKSWLKLDPDAELQQKILAAIEVQKRSEEWRKERCRYVPHLSSWLNNGRWEDEATKKPLWDGRNMGGFLR